MIRRKRARFFFPVLVCGYLVLIVSAHSQAVSVTAEENSAVESRIAEQLFRADALLMLERSIVFLEAGDWDTAGTIAAEGSRMSPDIADLWYVQALCAAARNEPAGDIIELLGAAVRGAYSLSDTSVGTGAGTVRWVRYNSSAARLMLAEYLTDTLHYSAALELIQDISTANSNNGQYIKARILYGQSRIDEARSLIRDAVMQYPADSRFPLLFFRAEGVKLDEGVTGVSGITEELRRFAEMLIGRLSLWRSDAPLTLLYAVPFVSGREERIRLLQEYRASAVDANRMPGRSEAELLSPPHPLSSVMALEEGLISFDTAFSELFDRGSPELDFTLLRRFAAAVPDRAAADKLSAYLTSFEGTLVRDMNGDGITELSAAYSGGIPLSVSYDKDQDGYAEASAACEYGVPSVIHVPGAGLTIFYDVYPSVSRAELDGAVYTLVPGSLNWAPFRFRADSTRLAPLAGSFLFPLPDETSGLPSERVITANSSALDMPDTRNEQTHPGARIRYSLFRGQPVSAVSSVNGTPFAYLVYENGILRFRNSDEDGDGFYETTKVYRFAEGKGAVLSQALADLDKDGYPEYSEEYTDGDRETAGWDMDRDGVQEALFMRSGDSIEESFFIHPSTGAVIGIKVTGGIPESVTSGGKTLFITRDGYSDSFFWIGDTPGNSETIAEELINLYEQNGTEGVPYAAETGGADILIFPSGRFYFGEIIREK